jgi:hypothetical protein
MVSLRLESIVEAPITRAYAAILSLAYALTGFAWFSYKHVALLTTGDDSVCWPVFSRCDRWRAYLSPELVRTGVAVMMILAVVAAVLFMLRRATHALLAFGGATIIAAVVYALDYRLRFNQTYMFGWVVLVFFLTRARVAATQIVVALFYFWAGTLKMNAEWISGSTLYGRPLFVPVSLIPAACVYVLVLELVLIFGLFARRAWTRWVVYAQLLLFHAVSWKIVGYYYPLMMLALTAIYPLVWRLSPADSLGWDSLKRDREVRGDVARVAAAFSAFQMIPWLFPGDTSVTGEGRTFALHMFDAKTTCVGGANVTTTSGQSARIALINPGLDTRTRCDPVVLFQTAQRLCRTLQGRPDRTRVDVAVDARRSNRNEFAPLIHVDDFCARNLEYSILRHNEWLSVP